MNFLKQVTKIGRKDSSKETKLYMRYVSATLVNGNLKRISVCPKYIELTEWLAVNTFDFFQYTNLFYGTIQEFCTIDSCPAMCAGATEYQWTDSNKKTIKVHASQYIDYVMTWIQNLLDDESLFPTKAGVDFHRDFHHHLKQIYKQLFRVFAHIYHSHFNAILALSTQGHLNTLLAHFICFGCEFELLDRKELGPMIDFVTELESNGRI